MRAFAGSEPRRVRLPHVGHLRWPTDPDWQAKITLWPGLRRGDRYGFVSRRAALTRRQLLTSSSGQQDV
jgi:hypothetical protein